MVTRVGAAGAVRKELSRVWSFAMKQLCPGVSCRDILLAGNRLNGMLEASNGGIGDIASEKIVRRSSAMAKRRQIPGRIVEENTQESGAALVLGIRGDSRYS